MPFEREWNETCPRIWDQWEYEGQNYIIRDIPPEDDERALQILLEQLCPDEVLCKYSDLVSDTESMASIKVFWVECLSQRMSLGCYTEVGGEMTLIALNVCVVDSVDERYPPTPISGAAWKNVFNAMAFLETKMDSFEYLKLNTVLHAYGLVVAREFRGARLGAKLLRARQPLALSQGVKGTSTVFTGPASQKLAASCGFVCIYEITLREIAEAGYNYPKIDHVVKLMVKKYCDE